MQDLDTEITEISAGYSVALKRLGNIWARHGIGSDDNGEYGWLAKPYELDKLLVHAKTPLLVNKSSGLIKPVIIGGTDYLDSDRAVKSLILDDYIGEGHYDLNFLRNLLCLNELVSDNWYRVVSRVQYLLAKNSGHKDTQGLQLAKSM